ncbi:MAG: helix-hairpin-helix domain-containing protein [Prevotella sp.]|nr:helix-hairpin-helix domain-containing protein [Prevotella sp.]
MRTVLLGLALWALLPTAYAQQDNEWLRYYNEIALIDDVETEGWEDSYNLMCEMAEHPINLNRATAEDLEQMPFLTASQIEDICEYLYMYGSVRSFAELKMINSLDTPRRKLLECFTYLGADDEDGRFPSVGKILKYGQHEIIATGKVPLYTRKGESDGKYLGDRYKHSLRYTFNYGNYMKLGFIGSKDAGEPFFTNGNGGGYDNYGAYLQLKKLGCADVVVLGDFKMSFGMGLVVNSCFSLGKLSMIANLGRASTGIRGSVSSYGMDKFRGGAAMFRLNSNITVSAFASYRKVDATLSKDSLTITSIVTSGYHRTVSEMTKKNNTSLSDAGANISWRNNGFHLGLTAIYSHLDRRLQPNTAYLYRTHYPAGTDFLNTSVSYGYNHHIMTVNGETAMDNNGHIATINSLSVNFSSRLAAMLLQRFYSYRYSTPHGRSFAEGGRVQNESGIYGGLSWQCLRSLTLMAYTDYAYFAWPRMQASQSSHSCDNMVQALYSQEYWSLSARYRLRIKERDNEDKTALTNQSEHRARIILAVTPLERLSLKTQADMVRVKYLQTDKGYAVSQMATLSGPIQFATTAAWSVYGSITYFHSDAYNSRLYVYERGPLYSFYVPSFYGEGIRYTLMAKVRLQNSLTLTAKLGVTDYFDRSTIGSGTQMIDGSSQTELDIQLKWKF